MARGKLYRLTAADVGNIKQAMQESGQQDWMEPVFRALANPVPETKKENPLDQHAAMLDALGR